MELKNVLCGLFLLQVTLCSSQSLLFDNDGPGSKSTNIRSVHEGESVVFDCEAGGSPTPTLHWLFNDQRMAVGNANSVFDDEAFYEHTAHNAQLSTLDIGSTKSKFFIDCVDKSHEGVYICVGDTETKRITKKFVLQVEGRAGGSSAACAATSTGTEDVKARIYMWTAQRLEVETADVQLFCRAEGFPAPRIIWVDPNGKPIEAGSNSQYELIGNGDLLIKRITFEKNMGLYTCVAENEYGRDETGAFLYPTTLG